MAVMRHGWRATLRVLIAIAVSSLAAPASGDGPDAAGGAAALAARNALVGEYRHSTITPAGKTRRSVAVSATRGSGLSVMWEEDEGNLFGGIGVSLDGVFGAAYTEALNGAFRGAGVLAYRIHGGTLDGVRLPRDSASGELIEETLQGSSALEGRYVIVRSVDPHGATFHFGYVEIVRRGDTYQMTWYTPAHSYDGVGLRIGDVLVAGYARGFAPGLIAYCADEGLLTGVGTVGQVGTVGADRMVRANGGSSGATAEPSAHCRDAVEKWNPSLVRG
jgi:hypothetical protein